MHVSLPKRFPLFILASVCTSLQCLVSALTQGGGGGHLFRLACSVALWGGRNTANKYHWCVWGALAVSGLHWVCPRSGCVLSQSTQLRLQVALQGNCLKRTLGFVHFPGLSRSDSGSWYSITVQTRLGLCFVSFTRLSSSGDRVPGERTLLRWGGASYYFPSPGSSVSWVHSGSAVSVV